MIAQLVHQKELLLLQLLLLVCVSFSPMLLLMLLLLVCAPFRSMLCMCCCYLCLSPFRSMLLLVLLTGARLVCGHCERLLHPLCLQPPALSLDTMLSPSWECPSCGQPNQVRFLLLP